MALNLQIVYVHLHIEFVHLQMALAQLQIVCSHLEVGSQFKKKPNKVLKKSAPKSTLKSTQRSILLKKVFKTK